MLLPMAFAVIITLAMPHYLYAIATLIRCLLRDDAAAAAILLRVIDLPHAPYMRVLRAAIFSPPRCLRFSMLVTFIITLSRYDIAYAFSLPLRQKLRTNDAAGARRTRLLHAERCCRRFRHAAISARVFHAAVIER